MLPEFRADNGIHPIDERPTEENSSTVLKSQAWRRTHKEYSALIDDMQGVHGAYFMTIGDKSDETDRRALILPIPTYAHRNFIIITNDGPFLIIEPIAAELSTAIRQDGGAATNPENGYAIDAHGDYRFIRFGDQKYLLNRLYPPTERETVNKAISDNIRYATEQEKKLTLSHTHIA